MITEAALEAVLNTVVATLDHEFKAVTSRNHLPKDSDEFEEWVIRELNKELLAKSLPLLDHRVDQQFPDLTVGNLGIEVKYVSEALWSGVANSINESHRVAGLQMIYVVFGKGGYKAASSRSAESPRGVRWGRYEDVVYHARTSHRVRFEIDMSGRADRSSLFKRWGVEYKDFAALDFSEKMGYMKAYARSRQQEKDLDFWWLPPDPKLYMDLLPTAQDEALALACLMCPQIVTGSEQARKDVALCMQNLKGVLSHETRAIFTADTLAGLRRIELVIESEARKAIYDVFQVYWGMRPEREKRIPEWIRRLDAAHQDAGLAEPKPSSILFGGRYAS